MDAARSRCKALELERKVARLEEELTAARLSVQRAVVQQALMDERLLTLEHNRLFGLWGKVYRAAANLYARIGTDDRYGGLSDLRTPGDYARWVNRKQQELEAEDHRGAVAQWRSQPLISVRITAVPEASEAECRNSLRSLFDQCYPHWELCVDTQAPPRFMAILKSEQRTANTAEATGDYLLTLHAGDRLSPHALYFYARALQQDESPEVLYADEDFIGGDGIRSGPLFKPAWSPELLLSTMYLGRAVLCRRGVTLPNPSSLDKNLRVRHVPRVLYHRAKTTALEYTTPHYTAPPDSRLCLIICSRQIRQLRECLKAVRETAATPIELLVVHHLEAGNGDEMRRCVEHFGGTWIPYRGAFNFARMNNLAAEKATAPQLLFMNDDVIVRQPGWDQALSATLARTEIGIAGALLQYPNGTIQHGGVVVGMGDAAGHCGRFQMTSDLWPWLRMSRDVTAVTGAMLGIRLELFRQMRGFDEIFPVNYNDVDLCLRVRKAGLRVVCLNVGNVIHRESQTRVGGTRYEERDALYKRWAEVLARPDEFYCPHLAPTERIALDAGDHPLQKLL